MEGGVELAHLVRDSARARIGVRVGGFGLGFGLGVRVAWSLAWSVGYKAGCRVGWWSWRTERISRREIASTAKELTSPGLSSMVHLIRG